MCFIHDFLCIQTSCCFASRCFVVSLFLCSNKIWNDEKNRFLLFPSNLDLSSRLLVRSLSFLPVRFCWQKCASNRANASELERAEEINECYMAVFKVWRLGNNSICLLNSLPLCPCVHDNMPHLTMTTFLPSISTLLLPIIWAFDPLMCRTTYTCVFTQGTMSKRRKTSAGIGVAYYSSEVCNSASMSDNRLHSSAHTLNPISSLSL